eukprot:TRINITY_DN5763_c0_g1_i6.p1 TRINITY_DN5763_c0_g1~~TRINITY_DN5763_c0_g1_i6.p1  ORF type:complete len:795 (-),score=154.08 TRINITY_DN5763_c0_g1_i6:183-2567(-)
MAFRTVTLPVVQRATEAEQEENQDPNPEVQQSTREKLVDDRRRNLYGPGADEIFGTSEKEPELASNRKIRKQPRKRRKRNQLTPHLARMMGEANMLYSCSEYQKAVDILLEIVKQNPNVPDPYHTLGLIHEEIKQIDKAIEFFMIAAHLTPKNAQLWTRIAEISRSVGDKRRAIYCYTKAIRLDPLDVDALWDRTLLYQELEQTSKAIEGYLDILSIKPGDIQAANELTKIYNKTGQHLLAVDVLERALEKEFDLNLANMCSELYLEKGDYQKCLELIDRARSFVEIAHLPIELTTNCGICQAYLGQLDMAKANFSKVLEQSVETYGDLYYNAAETCVAVSEYALALDFYDKLAMNKTYDTPALWLKQAQCHRLLGNKEESIRLYRRVLGIVPNNVEACLYLSEIFTEMGKMSDAVSALKGYSHTEPRSGMEGTSGTNFTSDKDYRVSVHQGFLHYSLGEYEEFLAVCLPVVKDRTIISIPRTKRRKPNEEPDLVPPNPVPKRGRYYNEAEFENDIVHTLGQEKYFRLISSTCKALIWLGRGQEANPIIKDCILYFKYVPGLSADLFHKALYLGAKVGFASGNFKASCQYISFLCTARPQCMPLWNFFYKVQTKAGRFTNTARFLTRLVEKQKQVQEPQSIVPIQIMIGNHALLTDTYKLAIAHYFQAYRIEPYNPFLNMMIGIAFLSKVMGRILPDRHHQVMLAFAFFFRYYNLQNRNKESTYNLARAFHQLGMFNFAIPLYEKVLGWQENFTDPDCDHPPLVREAAYNLALIYKHSGSEDLARNILREYVTI